MFQIKVLIRDQTIDKKWELFVNNLITTDIWMNIVTVYNPTDDTVKLFVDGEEVGSLTSTADTANGKNR